MFCFDFYYMIWIFVVVFFFFQLNPQTYAKKLNSFLVSYFQYQCSIIESEFNVTMLWFFLFRELKDLHVRSVTLCTSLQLDLVDMS